MTLNMEQPALSILNSKLSLTMQKLIVHFTFTARAQKTNGSNEGNSLVQKKEDMSFTGKSLSEALLLQNTRRTCCVLNVRSNFCAQHVLPRFELGIFKYVLNL